MKSRLTVTISASGLGMKCFVLLSFFACKTVWMASVCCTGLMLKIKRRQDAARCETTDLTSVIFDKERPPFVFAPEKLSYLLPVACSQVFRRIWHPLSTNGIDQSKVLIGQTKVFVKLSDEKFELERQTVLSFRPRSKLRNSNVWCYIRVRRPWRLYGNTRDVSPIALKYFRMQRLRVIRLDTDSNIFF